MLFRIRVGYCSFFLDLVLAGAYLLEILNEFDLRRCQNEYIGIQRFLIWQGYHY